MLDWSTRIALELIGQGGLGYSFDSLTTDCANPYGDAMKELMSVLQVQYLFIALKLWQSGPRCFRS